MKHCPKCNQELDSEALFCTKCGAKQELKCVACGAELLEDSKFCIKCGKAVNSEEILEMQNTSKPCEIASNISKIKCSSNYFKITISIIVLAIISLVGYFAIYGTDRNLVKLELDRGVSVKIPKEWNIVEINKTDTEYPIVETLLLAQNINDDNFVTFKIFSNTESRFTPEGLKNISKEELDKISENNISVDKICRELTKNNDYIFKHLTYYHKTKTDVLKYPSIYYCETYGTSKRGNMVSYAWEVSTKSQELNIYLVYDMDIHSDNKLFETVTKIVLPSLTVK